MKHLSIRELRSMLPNIMKLLNKNGSFVITRYGKPVARVTPYTDWDMLNEERKQWRESLPLSPSSTPLIRADREGIRE